MPAIARSVNARGSSFYWHLGDFRAIYRFDQDYAQAHQPTGPNGVLAISDYLQTAWQDFIDNQLEPFGATPVYLAFGNHELIPPKNRNQAIDQFADWLNAEPIRRQRLLDNPHDHSIKGYYHWTVDGIDFITLDNASPDQFDSAQLKWLQSVLNRDAANTAIRALVVGMHEALPDSISADHSMNQSETGTESGQTAYGWLLEFKQKSNKPVYTLASHSHFLMEGIFNTDYWRNHGGVLPGWIVGTAGAERYSLPPNSKDAAMARTKVYGYLYATVTRSPEDPVHFQFVELAESDVPGNVVAKYSQPFIHDCWVNNPVQ